MITVDTYKGHLVAVFGLGRTGLAAARALKAGGAHVVLGDENETALKAAAAQGFETAVLDDALLENAAALVLSPGVPLTHPKPHRVVEIAKKHGCPVIGDTELFASVITPAAGNVRPVVGITGTNGKSTTTALIGHCLQALGHKAEVGGNIGHAVLDLEPAESASHYVVELSSYQIDLSQTLHCDVAILLNLSADHLDRHGDMKGYIAAKRRLFEMQRDGAHAIIGVDDADSAAQCAELAAEGRLDVTPISITGPLAKGVYAHEGQLFDAMDGAAKPVMQLADAYALPGAHNGQNMAAAYATCRHLGAAPADIVAAIQTFPGLAHRIETVGQAGRVRFVNDSKATNAEAAAKALGAFKNIYWIAGGLPKEGGLAPLYAQLENVRAAYLIGQAADAFADELAGKATCHQAGTLATAVEQAAKGAAASGEEAVVLLSPACASFDQFKDFESRGEAFRAAVLALPEMQNQEARA